MAWEAGDNETSVEQALEALNAGDLDGYMELYDRTCTTHGFAPEAIPVEGLRGFYDGLLVQIGAIPAPA